MGKNENRETGNRPNFVKSGCYPNPVIGNCYHRRGTRWKLAAAPV